MGGDASHRRNRPRQGLTARWHESADRHLTPTKRSLIVTWISFGTTWGAVRLITHGIRDGWLPWGNISAAGRHFHHYNLGIGTLACVGLVAVRGDERAVGHPALAAAYGSGTALIADEFALLLDLRDVYWARQGRLSVDVSLGILSALGAYLTAVPFWHECARVTRHHLVSATRRDPAAGQRDPHPVPNM
ncbi:MULTISPECIES: hypothetical protein [unclassified Streptomyces]|uniref:hypothetical protein n=1 Tax=unclassified Streptomyces TaxID=2593676 RepID=UPI000F44BF46|nr:hypothetical protein [Streptomyces sp. I6]RNL73693.1 hypothetical protein EBF04_27945 [Streptomyces sp. I6]